MRNILYLHAVLSPPMSPRRVSGAAGADVDNVCTIIKDVCQTEHIGPDAIQRLCAHVDTDDQEQEVSNLCMYVIICGIHSNFRCC